MQGFSLKSLGHENRPENDRSESNDSTEQRDEERAEGRNKNDKEAGKPECGGDGGAGQPEHEALYRVETDERVSVIRRAEQKEDGGNECQVGERAGDVFG